MRASIVVVAFIFKRWHSKQNYVPHVSGVAMEFFIFIVSNRSNYFKLCITYSSYDSRRFLFISLETFYVKAAIIMSSPIDAEKKGIFKKITTSTSSRTASVSSYKKPTASTSSAAQESIKPTKRATSVSKVFGDRMRNHVAKKGASSEPNTSRLKESNMGDTNELESPWRKVNVS